MSNYGPKQYKLYDATVNAVRKESRNTDGQRCYSGKHSVEASYSQLNRMVARYERLNRKQPVKHISVEEYLALLKKTS